MTWFPEVSVREADTSDIDSFGNKRVSSQHTQLFDGQLVHADNPLAWDTSATGGGGGLYSAWESSYRLTVDATPGAQSIRQTKQYLLYRAGQAQLHRISFADADPIADILKRAGYFDAEDGVFFEINGDVDLAITVRSFTSGRPVDTRRKQAAWNLDRLNPDLELNPSGVILDPTKAQHFVIDLQWLGIGRVRTGFDIGGRVIWVHEFNFSNVIVGVPYMRRPSLPVRYEITNIGSDVGASFKQVCTAVIREGGREAKGIPLTIRTDIGGAGLRNATTIKRNALALRLRTSHIRAFLKPVVVSLTNLGTGVVGWELLLNPAFTAALSTFTQDGQATEFSIEQSTYDPATAAGHRIAAGAVTGTNQNKGGERVDLDSSLGVAASIAGISDILALVVESVGAGSDDVIANISVKELF